LYDLTLIIHEYRQNIPQASRKQFPGYFPASAKHQAREIYLWAMIGMASKHAG
jgi:hypothetical protein